MTWHPVCSYTFLVPANGVSALVEGQPVAVFRTTDGELFAVGDVDPFCGAGVIARGIVGDRAGEPTVASPMLKQVFSLRTGSCLDEPQTVLPTYDVRRREDLVEVALR